jgi:hypothetical protein
MWDRSLQGNCPGMTQGQLQQLGFLSRRQSDVCGGGGGSPKKTVSWIKGKGGAYRGKRTIWWQHLRSGFQWGLGSPAEGRLVIMRLGWLRPGLRLFAETNSRGFSFIFYEAFPLILLQSPEHSSLSSQVLELVNTLQRLLFIRTNKLKSLR